MRDQVPRADREQIYAVSVVGGARKLHAVARVDGHRLGSGRLARPKVVEHVIRGLAASDRRRRLRHREDVDGAAGVGFRKGLLELHRGRDSGPERVPCVAVIGRGGQPVDLEVREHRNDPVGSRMVGSDVQAQRRLPRKRRTVHAAGVKSPEGDLAGRHKTGGRLCLAAGDLKERARLAREGQAVTLLQLVVGTPAQDGGPVHPASCLLQGQQPQIAPDVARDKIRNRERRSENGLWGAPAVLRITRLRQRIDDLPGAGKEHDVPRGIGSAGQLAELNTAGEGGLAVAGLARGIRPEGMDVACAANREQLDAAGLVPDRQDVRPAVDRHRDPVVLHELAARRYLGQRAPDDLFRIAGGHAGADDQVAVVQQCRHERAVERGVGGKVGRVGMVRILDLRAVVEDEVPVFLHDAPGLVSRRSRGLPVAALPVRFRRALDGVAQAELSGVLQTGDVLAAGRYQVVTGL